VPPPSRKLIAPLAVSIWTASLAVVTIVSVAVDVVVTGVATQALGATARLERVKKAAFLANATRTTLSAQISTFSRPPPTVSVGMSTPVPPLAPLPVAPAFPPAAPRPDAPPTPAGAPWWLAPHA